VHRNEWRFHSDWSRQERKWNRSLMADVPDPQSLHVLMMQYILCCLGGCGLWDYSLLGGGGKESLDALAWTTFAAITNTDECPMFPLHTPRSLVPRPSSLILHAWTVKRVEGLRELITSLACWPLYGKIGVWWLLSTLSVLSVTRSCDIRD
jgi:hypothetical protein